MPAAGWALPDGVLVTVVTVVQLLVLVLQVSLVERQRLILVELLLMLILFLMMEQRELREHWLGMVMLLVRQVLLERLSWQLQLRMLLRVQ